MTNTLTGDDGSRDRTSEGVLEGEGGCPSQSLFLVLEGHTCHNLQSCAVHTGTGLTDAW